MTHVFIWANGKAEVATSDKAVSEYRFVAALLGASRVTEIVL
jgi:hypothetical protein